MARRRKTQPPPKAQPTSDDTARKAEVKRLKKEARLKMKLKIFQVFSDQLDLKLDTDNIVCFHRDEDGLSLYTCEQGNTETHSIHNRTLDSLEDLEELGFLRIHDATVLNMHYCRGRNLVNNQILLKHDIGITLKVSARYLPRYNAFIKRFGY